MRVPAGRTLFSFTFRRRSLKRLLSTYTSAECSAEAVGGRGATRWVVVMGNEFTGLPVRLLDGR